MHRDLTPETFTQKDIARFWSTVNIGPPESCWTWKRAWCSHGYGVFCANNRRYPAHRVALALTIGRVGPNEEACHQCDNPPCCNPAHLFRGSHRDNMIDMIEKERDACLTKGKLTGDRHWMRRRPELVPRGEQANKSNLTEDDVRAIRAMHRPNTKGHGIAVIGRQFGVSPQTIYAIVRRKTWRHVE